MAEETKKTEDAPKAGTAGPSNAEIAQKLREELKRVTKLMRGDANFGEGKPGKVRFTIPRFDPQWKIPDFKTINAHGKRVFKQGAVYELTYNEIEDLVGRFSARRTFETVARTGRPPIDINLSNTGGSLF